MVELSGFAFSQFFGFLTAMMLGAGAGIPLGVPPAEADPVMVKIAPEECLYFTTWVGTTAPDAASQNKTEQLLSEPEVVAFLQELDRAFTAGMLRASQDERDEEAHIMKHAPLLVRSLITHPVTFYVESVEPQAEGVEVKGAFVANLGDDADEVTAAVMEFLELAPPELTQKVVIEGVECVRVQDSESDPPFTIGRKLDYLIVAVGDGSFEGVLSRAETPPPAWLTDAVDSLTVPRLSTFSYANMAGIAKLAGDMSGPEVTRVLDSLGLNEMTTAVSVSGLDETGYLSRTVLSSADPDKGLGAFVSQEPLAPTDLAGIPRDASVAAVVRLDPANALQEALDLADELEPRAAAVMQQVLNQIEQAIGLDVEEELLSAMGDVWTFHTSPEAGGLLAGWTLTVSLKDPDLANETHDKLLKFFNMIARNDFGRAPKIREFNFGGQQAYSFEMPDDDVFFAPSWCLTDSHLVVTILPQTLKSYLAGVKKGGESLADVPAVAELLEAEDGPCALVYQDVRSQFITFYPIAQFGVQTLARQMQAAEIDVDATKLPTIGAVAPHLLPSVMAARKTDDGFESYVHATVPGANMGATAPVMVALLLPAVQAAREAARRASSTNNLKQIALAMHNYHDTYRAFPAAYNADEAGKPLLSWRVYILPFIEEAPLFDQFHLDEPWNSPHNRTLIAKMPMVYRSPNSTADPGKTVYLGSAGKSGVLMAPKKKGRPQESAASGVRLADVTDGTSNTIMVVEADDLAAVIWTKPDDLEWDEDAPFAGLGGMRPGGFLASFCDGSVHFISRTVDVKVLKALFTKAGNERVGLDEF